MYKDKQNWIHVITFFVLSLCGIFFINKLNYPAVLNDEFGYWANIMSIAGYDWKELSAKTPYYSWGYSIWLLPIAVIVPSVYWYKVGFVLNLLFLYASYFICYKFGTTLFNKSSKVMIASIAMITILYPSNLIYAQETWSETLLYLMMWIVTYMLLKLELDFTWKKMLLINILLGYMYIIHARTIGLILVGFLVQVLILFKHKKRITYVLLMICTFILMYNLNDTIKNVLINSVYNNSDASATNNVGLDTNTIGYYFNLFFKNWNMILLSLGNKIVYVVIASGMTISFSVFVLMKELYCFYRDRKYKEGLIIKGWCILSLLSMLCICALQMFDWIARKDIVTYSRYYENAMGPLLFLSIYYLTNERKEKNNIVLITEIVLLCTVSTIENKILSAEGFFNSICSPVIGAFYDNIEDKNYLDICILKYCLGIGSAIILSNLIKNRITQKAMVMVAMALSFLIIGVKGSKYVVDYRQVLNVAILEIENTVEKEYLGMDIYYIEYAGDSYSTWPKYLQYIIPQNSIKFVDNLYNFEGLVMVNNYDVDTNEILNKIKDVECLVNANPLKLYKIGN